MAEQKLPSTQDPYVTHEQDPLRGVVTSDTSTTEISLTVGNGAINGNSASMNNTVGEQVGGGEDNFFSADNTTRTRSRTSEKEETSVMGRFSGSIQYSNTNNQRQYTDPGLIISGNR